MRDLFPASKTAALQIMESIYSEDRRKWPHGLNPDGFNGGLYLIREKRAHIPVGFAGFQIRNELSGSCPIKVGYYSIGILPQYRQQGLGKAAVSQLLAKKACLVDCVRALIVEGNTPSLRLAAALEVPVLLKRAFVQKQQKPSYLPIGMAAGFTGLGWKGMHDIGSLRDKMLKWDADLEPYRQHELGKGLLEASNMQVDPGAASNIFDTYIQGGRNVARSRIFGIPAGRLMEKYTQLAEPKNTDAAHHYAIYTDPKSTGADLKSHMWEKAIGLGNEDALANSGVFNSKMLDLIYNKGYLSTANMLKLFAHKFPGSPANTLLRDRILGVPGSSHLADIGEALRLAGNRSTVLSTPSIYNHNVVPVLEKIMKFKNPFLLGGAVLTTGLLAKNLSSKQASQNNSGDRDLIASSALAGFSPVLGSYGYKNWMHPNRNLGVTFGEMGGATGMEDIGQGHKAPAMAIAEMMHQDPRLRDFSVSLVPRNRAGVIQKSPKDYNILVNTGHGTSEQLWDGARLTHGHTVPHGMTAVSELPYLTDAVSSHFETRGDTGPSKTGPMLGYGENFRDLAKREGFQHVLLTLGIGPAIDQEYLNMLKQPVNKSEVLNSTAQWLRNHYANRPDIADRLASIPENHRILTISGSGRGDYVAIRAREAAEELERRGIKDVTVLAQLANSFNSKFDKDLVNHANIIALPKLPRSHFVNLQRIADIHSGSSGTSSLAESLISPTVFALPHKWGYNVRALMDHPENSPYAPGTLAERLRDLNVKAGFPRSSGQMELDDFNRGNMEYAHSLKGVSKINSGNDLVHLLEGGSLPRLKAQAQTRAAEELAKLQMGRGRLADILAEQALKNVSRQKLLGKAALLVSALGAGASGYLGYKGIKAQPLTWRQRLGL